MREDGEEPPVTLKLDHFLPYRLSVASNAVSSRIAKTYRKRFNLKITEWRLIAILAETERMTPQALTKATRMDKINVSRAAKALIARGLVAAAPNGEDGRSHFLSLTEAGRSLYAEIAPEALAMEAWLVADFSSDERALFQALLRRIESAAG
ncbi:MarR family winged helix-turn-helix transcriptional regulator [Sphingomonas sp. LaA6.9]|uniref:MarR family winged helix-turn-helix transcriptional regulator n=1 Tax=Sphingomonas sp. LaA6.9 TaxID=2919914 RepID=UPI001F4F7739|nr:MarR family transcriptional regulator [Sphingomonas sp. LaA6.9]MCJ8159703.1 MarR family transcriptional regulator [Sphingomonas sp. LaA6.9]